MQVHKCSEAEWLQLSPAELAQKLPARPVKTALRDPTNSYGSVLKKLLDELCLCVKEKMLQHPGRVKYLEVQDSTEFKQRLDCANVNENSVLITGDFRWG